MAKNTRGFFWGTIILWITCQGSYYLWSEQVKPMQYSVGIKSRADGPKLLALDPRSST